MNVHAWDGITRFITPDMLRILLLGSENNYLLYTRYKTTTWTNVFATLLVRHQQLISEKCDIPTKRMYFSALMRDGYIPRVDPSVRNNSVYCYASKEGGLVFWNIPSVQLMRVYWSDMLRGVKTETLHKLHRVFQIIVSLLPGGKETCSCCGWSIPVTEMSSGDVCCFCHDSAAYHCSIRVHKGVCFIHCTKKRNDKTNNKNGILVSHPVVR
jgi:hypothetical protein